MRREPRPTGPRGSPVRICAAPGARAERRSVASTSTRRARRCRYPGKPDSDRDTRRRREGSADEATDRKSVVSGQTVYVRVYLGVRRLIKIRYNNDIILHINTKI